jgi:UDP-glucose 4-epimerase
MKKILITGGAGFIGSHLTAYLASQKDIEIIVLDNLLRGNKIEKTVFNKIKFIEGDVRDINLVEKLSIGCDQIYHFAAILGVDIVADNPVETMDTEVVGTRNIINAALKNNVKKIIYASTSGVYGHSAIEKSVDENIMIDPRTSYAMAKRYNEIYLKAVHEEKGLESVSLRFFNVYGPRQDQRMVIPRFFEQAINDQTITVFGSGKQTRDFTYINDTIKAAVLLAENSRGAEIFNIANEKEFTILDLAHVIKNITKSNSEIHNIESPQKRYDYEVERRVGSSEKLFNLTGFRPETNIDEGLLEYYNSLKKSQ